MADSKLTPDEQAAVLEARQRVRDEARANELAALRTRAARWARSKSDKLGDEARRHDSSGMPANAQAKLQRSWVYDQYAAAVEAGRHFSHPFIESDPESAQFQTLAAASIREKAVTRISNFPPMSIG